MSAKPSGKIPRRVIRAIHKLVQGLRRRGIVVEAVYLFGSYARGDYLETSDIDIVIVSGSFRGMRFMERLDLIIRVQWEEDITPWIEAIPLTPEELEEKLESSVVIRDAAKYWVRLV